MAEEMTLEQQKALAMASARLRAQQAQSQAPNPAMPQGKVNWAVELEKQQIDEMPAWERAYRSLGAGFADIPLAVRQMLSNDKPGKLSELVTGDTEMKQLQREAADKREVDKYLSKKTDMGIMPDQILGMNTPTVGDTAQFYGKTAPTLLLPAARLAGLKGLMSNIGVGAGLSALDPTVEGESRGTNMVMGGAFSSVLPMATSAGKGIYNMVTQGGGQNRAGNVVAKALTEGGGNEASVLRQTIDRLRNATQQNATRNIPLTTAAQLRDAEIARLEAGSRARSGANWYDFDQNQARAVAGQFDQATTEAADLAARRGTRKSNWDTNWDGAKASVAPQGSGFMPDVMTLRNKIDVAMRSEESSNPAVMNMLKSMADEIDRLGPDFGPGNMQQIRANLSAKFNPINPNAYAAAPRDSAARLSVMKDLDGILNRATGNKWQGVVDNYAADSRLVDQAKAAGRVRQGYYDAATGRVLGVSADAAGDIPKITEASLGRAMNAARGPDKSLLLSNLANTRLELILDALRAQNIVQGVKRSATAGGGSNTASDMFAAKSAGAVADAVTSAAGGPAAAVGKGVIDSLRDYANRNKDRALAEALQNPQQMISLLEAKIASKAPMTAQEQYLYSLLRGAPAAAAN
jgi:hypothetical protein